jgi:hypothetical protein
MRFVGIVERLSLTKQRGTNAEESVTLHRDVEVEPLGHFDDLY